MAQLDNRLNMIITSDKNDSAWYINPLVGVSHAIYDSIIPNPDKIENSPVDPNAKDKASIIQKNKDDASVARKLYDEFKNDPDYAGTYSLMNPYTITKLWGAFDKGDGDNLIPRFIDSSTTRKYYEVDGDEKGGYAKNPTTAALIKWGEGDPYGRTPYQFQDFVFCKYWNKIPNNRLITLRRYPNPILDNLNYPTMVDENSKSKTFMHPLATLVGYFGDETENKLSEMISFTTGMNWEEIKSDVWTVTGEQEGMDKVLKMWGGGSWISQHSTELTNLLGVLNPDRFNANIAVHGLPPDPWTSGSYVNKILGPVNVIDKTQRRTRGLKFTNDITLKFHYVARPINGFNTKAALLDILANVLVVGSASAQFFGGAHKFMIKPDRYPFNANPDLASYYQGKLFGASKAFINNFMDQTTSGTTTDFGLSPIAKNLWNGFTEIWGDLFTTVKNLFEGNGQVSDKNRATKGTAKVIGERMRANMGAYPYLTGLRSIFTGMPIGDWHLTIGNPLNPIAMIGNLICDEISIKFGDELGPDDFPLEFTATVKLKHGMPRDRDAIESMFNRGAGRIYDISDEFSSSADQETAVDTGTGGTANKEKPAANKTPSGPFVKNLSIMPNYTSYAKGTSLKRNAKYVSSSEDLNSISSLNLNDNKGTAAGGVHILAPWALKNIM